MKSCNARWSIQSKDDLRTTQSGLLKNVLVLNLPPISRAVQMKEKGGNFKTRKFFNYPESFLYCLYSNLKNAYTIYGIQIFIYISIISYVSRPIFGFISGTTDLFAEGQRMFGQPFSLSWSSQNVLKLQEVFQSDSAIIKPCEFRGKWDFFKQIQIYESQRI